jgi:hypothetical protein
MNVCILCGEQEPSPIKSYECDHWYHRNCLTNMIRLYHTHYCPVCGIPKKALMNERDRQRLKIEMYYRNKLKECLL